MGQKANPVGLRLLITSGWQIECPPCPRAEFRLFLNRAISLRAQFMRRLSKACVSAVIVERRPNKKCQVTVRAARLSPIIGKRGENIEKLRRFATDAMQTEVQINVVEVKTPQADAMLIAQEIVQGILKRVSSSGVKRLMKKYAQAAMAVSFVKGVSVQFSGRRGGAEVASTESYSEGSVPLHKLRADIDFALAEAMTTYGVCGVKVWVHKERSERSGSGRRRQEGRRQDDAAGQPAARRRSSRGSQDSLEGAGYVAA